MAPATLAQFATHSYTSQQGFPSLECYWSLQDEQGFMWFATDRGLARFDGYKFEVFTIEDGLLSNLCLRLYEDPRGRIWIMHYRRGLSLYENGQFREYEHNDSLQKFVKPSFIRDIAVDLGDTMWFYTYNLGDHGRVLPDGTLDKEIKDHFPETDFRFDAIKIHNDWVLPDRRCRSGNINTVGRRLTSVHPYPKGFQIHVSDSTAFLMPRSWLELKADRTYADHVFSNGGQLFSINGDTSECILVLKNDIQDLEEQDSLHVWVAASDGLRLVNIQDGTVARFILQNISISSVLKDRESGVWITTLGKGLIYIPNPKMNSLESSGLQESLPIGMIENTGLGLFIGGSRSLFKLNLNYTLDQISTGGRGGMIQDITSDGLVVNGVHPAKKNSIYRDFTSRKIIRVDSNRTVGGGSGIALLDNDSVIYVSIFRKNTLDITSADYSGLVLSILKTSDSIILIGDAIGLHEFNFVSLTIERHSSMGTMEFRSNELIQTSTGIWVGTNGEKLIFLTEDSLFHLDNDEIPAIITSMNIRGDKLWIGGPEGIHLFEVDYSSTKPGLQFLQAINSADGLPNTDVVDFEFFDDKIWIALRDQVVYIDTLALALSAQVPGVSFTSLLVNNTRRAIETEFNLSYKENSVEIEYSGLSYVQLGSINYMYRIGDANADWILTDSRSLQFASLRPNKYHFEVKASSRSGKWGEPISMDFRVRPAWWNTWGFRSIMIFLLLAIGLAFRRAQQVRREKAAHNERTMSEYRQLALSAQMNPHFVFNSLNSIQNFILKSQPLEAYQYLSKYSKLMRQTLENLRSPYIPLEAELTALEAYIEMELIRFDRSFKFELEIRDDINIDATQIPGLLLQPILENAIWHGLLRKESGSRILIVRLFKKDEGIICQIQDNGVGRKNEDGIDPKGQQGKKHKSRGTEITKDRLRLLHGLQGSKFVFEIDDLQSDDGIPSGTRVTLSIPFLENPSYS